MLSRCRRCRRCRRRPSVFFFIFIGPRAFDSTSKDFLIFFGFGNELNLNGKTKSRIPKCELSFFFNLLQKNIILHPFVQNDHLYGINIPFHFENQSKRGLNSNNLHILRHIYRLK